MKKFLFAAALITFTAPAIAGTPHWADTVTYVGNAGGYPSCIMFQTTATGGVAGINNSSTGNSGATGYTGNAQWNVIGVGSGSGSRINQAGLIGVQLENSRLSNGGFTFDWTDLGTNASYGDCNTAAGFNAANPGGQ